MLRPLLPLAFLAAVAWAGCMGPQSPSERASDAARELNITSHFGDVASVLTMTSPAVREQFASRRKEWGKMIRVADVDLAGLSLSDAEHAVVMVEFQWSRADQGILHTTQVRQEWEATDGPWVLVREKRVSGDIGLFGEPLPAPSTEPRPDVQFATRVIR